MLRKRRKLIDPAEIGAKGGHARAQKLSPEERREACRLAAIARWKAYSEGKSGSRKSMQPRDARKRKLIDPMKSGAKGGHARARNLSAADRSRIAGLASAAYWKSYYEANPAKKKAREERDRALHLNPDPGVCVHTMCYT
jgi:hypothetical protein